MKFTKIIAIISAFALLAGCSEKKKPESSSEITGEPVAEDMTEENVYRTYNCDDFKKIDVPLNIVVDQPPVMLNSYDIPIDKFGERVPPCKESENAWDYCPNAQYFDESRADGTMSEEEYQSAYNEFMANRLTPSRGIVQGLSIDGNMLYIGVDYDFSCSGSHEYSIYRCNMDNDECEEIYRYSSLDDEGEIPPYFDFVIDNVIYYTDVKFDDYGCVTSCSFKGYDIDTHENKVIYESEASFYAECKNGKIVTLMSGMQIDNEKERDTFSTLDLESGEVSELYTVERNMSSDMSGTICRNGIFAYLKKPENSRKYDLISENYTLSTGIIDAEILYATDEKAVLVTKGDVAVVHTFDFTKMEHYVTDISGIDGTYQSHNGNLIIGKGKMENTELSVYYFIPELGIAMNLTYNTPHNQIQYANGIVYFTVSEEVAVQTSGMTGYFSTPTKICIFEDREE